MKNLILFILLIPACSFAQNFEVSEMGGYSKNVANNFFDKSTGYTNQLSVSYYFTKYFSIGGVYEVAAWKPATNAYGFVAEAHLKHFYFGLSEMAMYISAPVYQSDTYVYTPKPEYVVRSGPVGTIGLHVGSDQQLCKHLFIKEQLGYHYATATGLSEDAFYTIKIQSLYGIAGVAYRF